MENILITICARGGSKGIPGKNIRMVGGRPLLAYSADIAKKFASEWGADVVLSTDSEEIRTIGKAEGIFAEYERPEHLANDTIGKVEAIKDVVEYMERHLKKNYDVIIDLDVTSPIRTVADIEKCVEILKSDKNALTVFSVNPCGRNPYFNMVEQKDNGYYNVVCQGKFDSRQSAPRVYDMNASIYAYRREALERENPRAVTERSLIFPMNHICFDLDEPEDFEYFEYLMEKGKVKL